MVSAHRGPRRLLCGIFAATLTLFCLVAHARVGERRRRPGRHRRDQSEHSPAATPSRRPPSGPRSRRSSPATSRPPTSWPRGCRTTIERRAIQWAAIYYGDGEVDYSSVLQFSQDAPAFAGSSVFKTRLEQALTKADAHGAERHQAARRRHAQYRRCADRPRPRLCGGRPDGARRAHRPDDLDRGFPRPRDREQGASRASAPCSTRTPTGRAPCT